MIFINKLFKNKFRYILILFILTLLFYHRALINFNQVLYPAADNLHSSFQEKILFSESVRTYKSLPLWNPYIFSGSPFLGNPTSGMFYPLNMIFLILPNHLAFTYMFIIDTFLIGLFTYFYTRAINIDKFGSVISSITIMFSGPIITSIYPGHIQNINTFIWFPLALYFLELLISKRKNIYIIFLSITISLMFLSGFVQLAVFEIISLFIYFLIRALGVHNAKQYLILSCQLIFSLFVGILISAVQLLPSFEFSQLSERYAGLSYNFASDFSFHPKQVLSFVLPYFFGSPINGTYWGKGNFWELNGYIGILPLFFAIMTILFKRKKYAIIFLIMALFSLLYSFGRYSYIFPFFYDHIPKFDNFRVPSRFRYIYVFSLSVLSGIGVNFVLDQSKKIKQALYFKFYLLLLTLIISFVFILLFLNANGSTIKLYESVVLRNSFAVGINHKILYIQMRDDIIKLLLIFILFIISFILTTKNKISNKTFRYIIFILVISDLFLYGLRFIDTKKILEIYKDNQIISKIKEDKGTYRVFDMGGTFIPLLEYNNIELVTGVNPLYLKDYRDFLWALGKHEDTSYDSFFQINEISNPTILNLLNTKYVISNKELKIPGYFKIVESNSSLGYSLLPNRMYYLYMNTNTLPRAYIIPNAVIVTDNNKVLKLLNKNFNPKRNIILEKNPMHPTSNPSSFTPVELVSFRPNEIKLKTSLSQPGFLVLSEIWYPGWRATDNGHLKTIYRANYIFRSIFLEKGSHDIIFSYEPDTFKIGKYISSVSILVVFFVLLILRKKRQSN